MKSTDDREKKGFDGTKGNNDIAAAALVGSGAAAQIDERTGCQAVPAATRKAIAAADELRPLPAAVAAATTAAAGQSPPTGVLKSNPGCPHAV